MKSFNDVRLDPVMHIKTYISRTRAVRASKRLFVITMKPFTLAARGTLSRWISDIISSSGQARKGGSYRSVGLSKVNMSHLLLESILEASEWSRLTTFFKFYCVNYTNKSSKLSLITGHNFHQLNPLIMMLASGNVEKNLI